MNDMQTLDRAKNLLEQGRFDDSIAIFAELARKGPLAPEALYGMAFAEFKKGDLDDASADFRRCLRVDPKNANATYYLGRIADAQGEFGVAKTYYQRAVSINPRHAGALKMLGVDAQHPQHGQMAAHFFERKETTADDSASFYSIIAGDNTPLSKQTIELIDAIALDRRPRLLAFAGDFLFQALALLAILFVILLISYHPMLAVFVLGAVAFTFLWMIVSAFTLASIKARRYRFDRGFLYIKAGLLATNETQRELLHLTDIGLQQSVLDRLTRNGKLTLTFDRRGKPDVVIMRGLASIDELRVLRTRLLNLSRLLRGNPLVRGIIS